MRSIARAAALSLVAATAAMAQVKPAVPYYSGDVALTYHWVRTNTQPGECGCFDLNGGGVSGSWNLGSRWSAVAEIGAEHATNALSTGKSLTLTSFLGGARYHFVRPRPQSSHALQPFGQLLLGAGHAGGGMAGAGDATYALITRMGGGIDLPLGSVVAIRVIQVDYYLTNFANGVNDHQNNLLLGAGVVFHWSTQK
jgi:outer membrane immunogenic protein